MDYKEKVIALLNSQELSKEQKEKLEEIFPELKESEDERIRKELIEYHKAQAFLDGKPNNKHVKYVAWLEKQVGQKPADKVEPKFREGEWLCENEPNNYARFIQILETVNVQGKDRYRISRDIHKDEDVVELGFVEKYYHKFDIKDAKDGDVLCCENGWTCIFKTLVNNETFSSYCFMDNTKWFCETGSECHTLKKEFVKAYNGELYPATKEQRDTFERAMTNAGYTFDFENKELKKVEQKPTTMSLDEAIEHCKEKSCGNNACALEHKQLEKWLTELKELKEQKPTWSEEDEKIYRKCICAMRASACGFPEEEKFVEQVDNWFKSLKDRVQPKQEWSEEDRKIIIELIGIFESAVDGGHVSFPYRLIEDYIRVLKSCLHQNTWKPIDDEMKALSEALSLANNCGEEYAFDLRTLYEQLKKLKG